MMLRLAFTVALLWAELWTGAAMAESDPAGDARAASQQLQAASALLDEAQSARNRVRALTETVRAYESGLAAMREGLRRTTAREARLGRQLKARQDEISQLLGVLQTIEFAPPPVLLLHPAGPQGSARAAMMLAEVTPALTARAATLRQDLEEIRDLRQIRQAATKTLEKGLAGVQQARAGLSKAIADRTGLPRRFAEDPVRTAILISSADTLEAFAEGLGNIAGDDIAGTNADISDLKGRVPLPVQGIVLHRAGEADAAGIKRDGIILATRPRALVSTPTAATIRYRGPLLDLGNVMILEPQPGLLFVLSGLSEVFGETGQVLPQGSPVGLMGGTAPQSGAILSLSGEGTGTERSETLYIEVREGGSPVNPLTWFQTDKDG
ncbi:MAG: peptidase M23 [Rhodobacteraceae bacterium]|nr:MAG: peptidase M23 [Paracoccaceae bacterium]